MRKSLSREKVIELVVDTIADLPNEECRTCDCFTGLLTRLELDAAEDVSVITGPFKQKREDMHA